MVGMFTVFMSLLCWLHVHFMVAAMFGSHHVFTSIWMDNVSMA